MWKSCILCDSTYMTLWKRQNYGDGEQIGGWGGRNEQAELTGYLRQWKCTYYNDGYKLCPNPWNVRHRAWTLALTGETQLIRCCPAKQKVAGQIPGWGTCLVCRFSPWSGCVQEATDQCFSHLDVFLPSLPPPLPLFLIISKVFLKSYPVKTLLNSMEVQLSECAPWGRRLSSGCPRSRPAPWKSPCGCLSSRQQQRYQSSSLSQKTPSTLQVSSPWWVPETRDGQSWNPWTEKKEASAKCPFVWSCH